MDKVNCFSSHNRDDNLSICLAIACFLIAVIPMAALYIVVSSQGKSTLAETLFQELEVKSFLIKRDVERFYLHKMVDLKNLSQADVFETNDQAAIDQYVNEIAESSPSFIDVKVVSLDGVVLSNSSGSSEKGVSVFESHAHFRTLINSVMKAKQGDVFMSPLTELDTGGLGVVLMTPITDDINEKVIKLLLVETSLEPITDLLKEINSIDKKAEHHVSIIESKGLVVSSSDLSLPQLKLHPDFVADGNLLARVLSKKDSMGSGLYYGANNKQTILGFSNIFYENISPNLNWTVVVTVPYEEILAPAKTLANKLSLAALVVAIIVFTLMYLASRKIMSAVWLNANFDSITGLPNRKLFVDRFFKSIQLSKRENNSSALLYIDLDRFKEINDSLGHDVGDKLLIETASRLSLLIRKCDSVARVGGDEFSIILGEVSDPIKIDRVADSVITSLNNPFYIEGKALFISASIGIAIYPDDGDDITTLMKSADQALYSAKNKGRNRYIFFTSEMQQLSDRRHRISNDLRSAIPNNEFELFYQSIENNAFKEVPKAEALIRWNHPELGSISPDEFISIAEETNFISELGDWVFHESVNMICLLKTKYNLDFNISINMSPIQFKSKNFVIDWLDHLKKRGVSGKNITIEITEGLLLVNDPIINNQLHQLRNAGISISLDDFGTGYSSLAYLRKFSIDILKIDKAFVDEIVRNSDDLALCEAITVMAKILGIQVVAEGVETKEQSVLLFNMDVDYCQGYFFSRPLAHAGFINYLLSKHKVMLPH